jgi:uncharacterized protein (TIGR00730 family)
MTTIGVFLGSAEGSPKYSQAARLLGKKIAKDTHTLVCGANGGGLMGALISSVLEDGGNVIGILPDEVASSEIPHVGLSQIRRVDTVAERKKIIRQLSDVILVFPGGVGTLDEFFETFALKKAGLFDKPIGLLNFEGFYQPLISQIQSIVDAGFAKLKHTDLVAYSSSSDQLIDLLISQCADGKPTFA